MRALAIKLPCGAETLIEERDRRTASDLTLYRGTNGYVYFSVWKNGRSTPHTLHSFLMAPPKGMHVDHKNGDKLDNRRSNLRIVTASINQVNRKRLNRNNTSGVRGVTWSKRKRKWVAQICVNGRGKFLGHFKDIDTAARARRAAEIKYWGEQCPVN